MTSAAQDAGFALEVESLSLSIRDTDILRNISVRFRQGEIWSVIGANGAGKSTLLRCLMRIHRDWRGRVRLFGKPLDSYSQRELARRVAYVPQAGSYPSFSYTVSEFVRMGRYPYTGPFSAAHPGDGAAVHSAMSRAGVERFAGRSLLTLSGGERQKVFIAAALAQEADVLLMDEPTAFLDYRHQAEVMDILRSINEESDALIVNVTHDVNEAIQTGGLVLALREGEVAWSGPMRELTEGSRLKQIFQAEFRILDDPFTGRRIVIPRGGEE